MMYWGYGWGPMAGFGFIGILVQVIIWVVLVSVVVSILRGGRHYRRHYWRGSSALDILEERYAKGEINKEEFEQKKKDLLG